jgi:hypothetical protein
MIYMFLDTSNYKIEKPAMGGWGGGELNLMITFVSPSGGHPQ